MIIYNFVRPTRPWEVVRHYMESYIAATKIHDVASPVSKKWVDVRWLPPPLGWIGLNTDGASKMEEGMAGCGGLMRNADGSWLCGFAKSLGRCTAFVAELWGVYLGLQIAVDRGFPKIVLQVDSQAVATMISGLHHAAGIGRNLLIRIRELLSKLSEFLVLHVYREGNMCADVLANEGCGNLSSQLVIFEHAPASVGYALRQDLLGISTPRLISL